MPFSPANSGMQTQPEITRAAKYSFNWASGVVQRARQSHWRGWEILDAFLGLSDAQLAYLIACNAPEWAHIRNLGHLLDKWACHQEIVNPKALLTTHPSTRIFEAAVEVYRYTLPDNLKGYLTDRIKRLKLEEQVKKGPPPTGGGGLFRVGALGYIDCADLDSR